MSRRRSVFRKIIKGILFPLIFALLFFFIQRILEAKWMNKDHLPTLSMNEYESLEDNSVDVLFLGTSQVYSSVDPMLIYEETGITSYVISAGGMRFDLDYAALQAAVKTQNPKVVFLDASEIRNGDSKNEKDVRPMLDQLPISSSKLYYLFNYDLDDITVLNGLFPLLRYHSRWDSLDASDWEYAIWDIPMTSVRGHYISYEVVETHWRFDKGKDKEFTVPERPKTYLKKIVSFCEENGIEFVFYKLPTVAWKSRFSNAAQDLADELGIPYWEMYFDNDKIGVDPKTDFRDENKHMNQYGAEKVSSYLGKYLQKNYDLMDQRGSNERWDNDLVSYHELLESDEP